MFDLKDLEKDPGLLIDLKEDVREEAESCGPVTSVVLYDVSRPALAWSDSVEERRMAWMTVNVKDALAAQACVCQDERSLFRCRRVSVYLEQEADSRFTPYLHRERKVPKIWS